ncbi:MAG: hypothetical protein WCJ24_00985 [Candidatus Saccharibacteria bacterium]
MWPFNRSNQSATTSDAKDYYKSARPQRMWLVWLLSIATFIFTALIVLGIFWAGRWAVHKFTKSKVVAPKVQKTGTNNQNNPTTNVGSSTVKTSTPTPNTTPQPATTNSSKLVNTGPTSDE